jgi:hypothetical protein
MLRASRRPGTAAGSDATADVLAGMRFEPWVGAAEVDTTVEPERSLAAAVEIAPQESTRDPRVQRPWTRLGAASMLSP